MVQIKQKQPFVYNRFFHRRHELMQAMCVDCQANTMKSDCGIEKYATTAAAAVVTLSPWRIGERECVV